MKLSILTSFCAIALLSACSSAPKKSGPDWVYQPTRIVDNGYIVYIGSGSAGTPEKAQFKAEGQALEDLANECSMVPQGTRIEDRFAEKGQYEYQASVKIGVSFQECEEIKKAVDPEQIRKLGSLAFTQQLKRYQDLIETGEMVAASEGTEVEVPKELPPVPTQTANANEHMHFYVVRQYVAYQKEIVILSPPTAYAPASVESQNFVKTIAPTTTQLQTLETQNPQLKTQPQAWSHLADRPAVTRPTALSAQATKQAKSGDSWKKLPAESKALGNKKGKGPHSKHDGSTSPKKKRKKHL